MAQLFQHLSLTYHASFPSLISCLMNKQYLYIRLNVLFNNLAARLKTLS